eukprot:3216450-Alexandrium_andersonii.AAC.1
MSASLVGSEMCIRDSAKRPRQWGQAVRRRNVSQGTRLWQAHSRCCDAVSYTHLTLPTICSV